MHRDVSAQQRVGGRRRAAGVALLRVGRRRRDRHRQPRVGVVAEPVRRTGGDAPHRAGSRGRALLDSATRAGAEALGFGRDYGTLAAGQARGARRRRTCRPASAMWKNTWSAACRRRGRWPPRWPDTPAIIHADRAIRTYASFVRFSHSVFALPFALVGALLAARDACRSTWSRVGWIVACMVTARSAAMGFNRLVDAGIRRAQSRARPCASCRAAAMSRARPWCSSSSRRWCSCACACAARAASAWRCRRSRSRSCSGIRSPSASRRTRRRFSGWRWPSRRSAAGSRPAAAAARSRGCWAWRSARGSAASTCSTPARISTSTAAKGCGRFRCDSASRDRSRSRARMHVDHGRVPGRASASSRRLGRSISPASAASRCCSCGSSRSSAPTTCRRSSARST